jgi:hypothetical protein
MPPIPRAVSAPEDDPDSGLLSPLPFTATSSTVDEEVVTCSCGSVVDDVEVVEASIVVVVVTSVVVVDETSVVVVVASVVVASEDVGAGVAGGLVPLG